MVPPRASPSSRRAPLPLRHFGALGTSRCLPRLLPVGDLGAAERADELPELDAPRAPQVPELADELTEPQRQRIGRAGKLGQPLLHNRRHLPLAEARAFAPGGQG